MRRSIVRRIWWRTLRFLACERYSWNRQYEAGAWREGSRSPRTLRLATELGKGGKLVEFGCGEGNLAFLLPRHCYSEYIGYAISDVAVTRAKERAIAEEAPTVRFEQGDMANWKGTDNVSLILVEECIYYLSPSDVVNFLSRCMASLASDGVILVIVHSASKHEKTLEACRQSCRVVDESVIGSRAYLTLAPKDRLEPGAAHVATPV